MVEMKNRKYIVYKHTNKENGKIYIGITSQSAERRWQHGAGYYHTYFGNAIRKYGWDGFDHDILAVDLEEQNACDMEISLIKFYRSNERERGYNIAEGGQTMYCGAKSGPENPKAVAVIRRDPRTGKKKFYETITSASMEMGINHRGISKACRGVAKTFMGYEWNYADGHFQKPFRYPIGKYPHIKQQKKVKMVDLDGSAFYFDSLSKAAEATGVCIANIGRFVHGKRIDRTGRRWSICL